MSAAGKEQVIEPTGRYSSKQVAHLVFNRSVDWFYAHHALLRKQDGFPRPISTVGRPLWSGRVLLDWITRPTVDVPAAIEAGTYDGKVITIDAMLRKRLQRQLQR